MDHDAMWTHVQKLMKFRDDFLVMSNLTADQFHAMADRVRAGEGIHDVAMDMHRIKFDEIDDAADDPEPLGTDKSDGAVKREGQELPPTKDDGTDDLADGQQSKDGDPKLSLDGSSLNEGEPTADLGAAGASTDVEGAKPPATPENEQAGSTGAATGV
jgi:hypothetical protein